MFIINLTGIQLYRDGWGSGERSAQFCELMSLNRRVRAAHGRVAGPKPTIYTVQFLNMINTVTKLFERKQTENHQSYEFFQDSSVGYRAKMKLQMRKVALAPSVNWFLAALIKMWPTCCFQAQKRTGMGNLKNSRRFLFFLENFRTNRSQFCLTAIIFIAPFDLQPNFQLVGNTENHQNTRIRY